MMFTRFFDKKNSSQKGKIIFISYKMQRFINGKDYGTAAQARKYGAIEASKKGALAIIIRSVGTDSHRMPHTGAMRYKDGIKKIPAAALSAPDADLLERVLSRKKPVTIKLLLGAHAGPTYISQNVIGEITGSEFPNEYILVGGHLDSWDLGDGAHDDGAGVVQSMGVLRLFTQIGYKPKHTIRVVLFMNEENGLRGGKKYAKVAANKKENHVIALESDAGGFTPRGFSFDCSDENFKKVISWKSLFKPYLIHYFEKGGSGADIGPLKGDNVLCGLRPDSQRYFDHDHAATDTFEHVNKRELELGSATMTSLVYLFDKYEVIQNSKFKK